MAAVEYTYTCQACLDYQVVHVSLLDLKLDFRGCGKFVRTYWGKFKAEHVCEPRPSND